MGTLDNLAREYRAFWHGDKTVFRRKARILQSLWRTEQGYPIGTKDDTDDGEPWGSRLKMPWAEETLANFLTDTVRQVIHSEVRDPKKSKGKVYKKPRIYNDLLSSQPLTFNLFAHLSLDLPLASAVMRDLTNGRVGKMTDIRFEFSPGRGDIRYTGDHSAFDAYLLFEDAAGQPGFVGIEVKYHENLDDEPSRHHARYDEVARKMGCFGPETLDLLRGKPLQQIWRNHLLAGAHCQVDRFADGLFVMLGPTGNTACTEAAKTYGTCLTDCHSFGHWTLESFVSALRRHSQEPWIAAFEDRYLDFGKVDRLLS